MPQWLEIVLRTLTAVAAMFFLTRLLGKRQVTELSVFEYITGITIGSLAAFVSLDPADNWYLGLVAMAVWVAVSLIIEFLQLKSKTFRDFVDGKARVLIKDGKILEDNLRKERLTVDELLMQLRSKNAFKLSDVEFAVMEPSGKLNVLLRKEHQPLTPAHLGVHPAPEQEPQTVIMDGQIQDEPLATLGLNRQWLRTELDKLGVTLENVFLGQVDGQGQLTVDLYDDQLKLPEPAANAMLLARLKKVQAEFESFALNTRQEEAREMYRRNAERLDRIVEEIEPFLNS